MILDVDVPPAVLFVYKSHLKGMFICSLKSIERFIIHCKSIYVSWSHCRRTKKQKKPNTAEHHVIAYKS